MVASPSKPFTPTGSPRPHPPGCCLPLPCAQVFNFSAGPAILPLPVLEEAQRDALNFGGSGMSVMEMSHRSKAFEGIIKVCVWGGGGVGVGGRGGCWWLVGRLLSSGSWQPGWHNPTAVVGPRGQTPLSMS